MIERWKVDASTTVHPAIPVHATVLHGETGPQIPYDDIPDETAMKDAKRGQASLPTPKKPIKSLWGGRVAWLLAMVTVGVFLGLLIVTLLKFIDGPVVATEGKTLAQLQATPAVSPSLNLWDGQYAELKYPGIFDQIGHVKGSVNSLESYMLSSRGSYARQIAIDVGKLPSNNVEDDSSYKYRSINPALYSPQTITLSGEPVIVMVKADKSERTLFWPHKGMLLTVSLTSDNPAKDNLESYLAQIQPTVRWRQ